MATTVARLEAVLGAQTRDFDRAMDKSERVAKKATHAIKVGAGIASAAIGVGLAAAAKIGFDEFQQGQKVAAQTRAVLKSTGGAANVTAKHIEDLGDSLLRKTAIDDEVIKSGANMLLTFTNIRNEAGKSNDIFDQSTKTLLDMSTALGTDASKSAIQLGKALNDPVKGITALRRVGVTFTDAQKDQIQTMVDSGRTMDAQKLILRELNKEFGGSAEAVGKADGGLRLIKERFINWTGDMVALVMPTLLQFVDFVVPKITAAFEHIRDWIRRVIDITPKIIEAFKNQGGAMDSARKHGRALSERLADLVHTNFKAIEESSPALVQTIHNLRDSFSNLGGVAKVAVLPILGQMAIFLKFTLPAAIRATSFVLETLSGWLLKITQGIKWLSDHGARAIVGFKDASITALGKLEDAFGKLASALGKIKDAFQWLIDNAKKITGVFGAIGGAVGGAVKKVGGGDIDFKDMAAPSMPNATIDQRLWPAMGLGRSMGLNMISGYRPGATVRGSGARSDHSYFPSKAVDEAGSPSAMSRFAQAVTRLAGIDTVIYSPIGLWKAGSGWGPIRSAVTKADHYSHVHVDTFDKGGWLQPGLTLARNLSGKRERVLTAEQSKGHESAGQVLRLMREMWTHAAGYFRFLPQPPTKLLPDSALFVGVDPSEKPRTLYWPRWMSDALFGHGRGITRSDAFMTVLHEWAHAFQRKSVADVEWQAEGGATAFAKRVAPIVAGAMHFPYRTPSGADDPYTPFMNRVLRKLGLDWVMRGQFNFGVFDRGGWLPRGLSLAYNGTGHRERISGHGYVSPSRDWSPPGGWNFGNEPVEVTINMPNYVGSKPELLAFLRNAAQEFKRHNGRSAF